MRGDRIKIIIIGILVTVFLLFECPPFLHDEQWSICLVHHFFHANLFHLCVNCLAIWLVFKKDVAYHPLVLIIPFLCGSASWFLSPVDPVGASNFLFALMGLRTPRLSDPWWRSSSFITFIVTMIAMSLLPNVSAVTHIVSFVFGCMCSILIRTYRTITHDYHRATYHK